MVSAFEVNSSTRDGCLIGEIRLNGRTKCVSLLELRGLVPTFYAGVGVGMVLLRSVCVCDETGRMERRSWVQLGLFGYRMDLIAVEKLRFKSTSM
jgi:hypothetical protein